MDISLSCSPTLSIEASRAVRYGLAPKRKVLDNEASEAYKQSILEAGLTYQLVPPDDHHRNLLKKPSKHGKTTSFLFSVAQQTNFPYTYGANSYLTWNAN